MNMCNITLSRYHFWPTIFHNSVETLICAAGDVTLLWGMYSMMFHQNYKNCPDSLAQFLPSVERVKLESTKIVSKVTLCHDLMSDNL